MDSKRSKKYNYLYKTTNIINNKFYIGIHSTDNLNDGYIGCGIKSRAYARASNKYGLKSAFHDAVIKYGYENFKKEILYFTESKEDILELEELIVDREFIQNNNNYNISTGGSGGSRAFKFSLEKENTIFEDYMSGCTKKEISEKYDLSETMLWRIIKDKDRSNRKNKNKHNFKKRVEIENWVKLNAKDILKKYINWELSGNQINKITPFDTRYFNLVKGVDRNKKFVCIMEDSEDIFFDTQKEISEKLNINIFRGGYIQVIEGKINHYKGYKFRRTNYNDFKNREYDEIINNFLKVIWKSLDEMEFSKNRGIIQNN